MTNTTLHRLAIQEIPALSEDIQAYAPDPAIQRKVTELLEEKIAFMHLRSAKLPDGRRLIAAIEHGAIAQSILSAGPPVSKLPHSPALEPGDLARASWLWKSRDSARVADNLGDNIPDTRAWMMFLLNPHLARCRNAAWVLVHLGRQPPGESAAEEIVSRLITLLNNLLLSDFDELQQFLSGTPVKLTKQDVSRYRITAELLLRGRNLLFATTTHPFLRNQLTGRDVWRKLPRDAEDLLAHTVGASWAPVIRKLEDGYPSEEVLSSFLDAPAEVIRSMSSVTSTWLTPYVLGRLMPIYKNLDPSVLPRDDAEFLKITFLAGSDGTGTQRELLAAMSARIKHSDDLRSVTKWLRLFPRFSERFASFCSFAESLLQRYCFNVEDGRPPREVTLFTFLGEPTYNELDLMLDAWVYINKQVCECMTFEFGVVASGPSLDDLDDEKITDDLYERARLPGSTIGIGLWVLCLAWLIARFSIGYENTVTRAFSPGPDRGHALEELRKLQHIMAARP